MNMQLAACVFGARTWFVALGLVAGFLASSFTTVAGAAAASPLNPEMGVIEGSSTLRSGNDDRGELAMFDVSAWAVSAGGRIDAEVLRLALSASQCAMVSGAVKHPGTLTIIDYSKASVEPRLWVLDLQTRELLYEELVSHGQGSGGNLATKFSNTPESHQTSIGLFVTDQPYVGRNGYSLRLDGLDKGFNDRARERAIVMHGAPYVNASITKSLGRLGRSHGCPAVRDDVARELINRVKGGGLVFAYYPDAEWLQSSRFLGNCGN